LRRVRYPELSSRLVRYNRRDTSMFPRRAADEVVFLMILCVLGIFFFPATQGPYSAVNGPATALQAARTAFRLHVAIVHAALTIAEKAAPASLVSFWRGMFSAHGLELADFRPQCGAIFRC